VNVCVEQIVVDIGSLRAGHIDVKDGRVNVMAVIASLSTNIAVPNDAGRGHRS
jgi:hypothetical protein